MYLPSNGSNNFSPKSYLMIITGKLKLVGLSLPIT